MKKAVFIYSPEQLTYKFSDTHPFNHKRLHLTIDLLKSIGALQDEDIVPARIATDEE
ncbi:MAG TPA: acetoin utilization protein AcuC, partial [Kurthia sp.]